MTNTEECTVTTRHMMSIFDTHTYSIGCEHRSLAVATVNERDNWFEIALLLPHKTVMWIYTHGSVRISETAEKG